MIKFLNFFLRLGGIPLLALSVVLSIITLLFTNDVSFLIIAIIIFTTVSMGWYFAAGYMLFLNSNGKMKLSLMKYKVLGIYTLIYPLIFGWFITYVMNDDNPNATAFFALLPFHFFAMYAGFFQFRFTIVALRTVETKRHASLKDCGDILYTLWKPFGMSKFRSRIKDALYIEPIF